ncbi:UNVERIFIED_CONTAM: hypothetical protein K2H54_064510 [Gekko kuhli]
MADKPRKHSRKSKRCLLCEAPFSGAAEGDLCPACSLQATIPLHPPQEGSASRWRDPRAPSPVGSQGSVDEQQGPDREEEEQPLRLDDWNATL